MRNWKAFVRQHPSLSEFKPEREKKIVREVAAQLEDFYAEALSRGMTETEADAYARRQIKDWECFASDVRRFDRQHLLSRLEQWEQQTEIYAKNHGGGWTMFADLTKDINYGLRTLRRNPGFTAVAVITLALGIGANTAIFSVVKGVLLQPLPYKEPGRLVRVWTQLLSRGFSQLDLSEVQLIYYREKQQALEAIAVFYSGGVNLTGLSEPLRVNVSYVSHNLLSLLDVEPILGRSFTPNEDRLGNDRALILEHGFWQRQFGGDPGILGQQLELDGKPYTVVGVMPPGFAFPPDNQSLWVPFAINPTQPEGGNNLSAIARLKPGVALEQGNADIQRVALQYALDNFGGATEEAVQQAGWGSYLIPLRESLVGNVRPALLLLLGAVGFVLLIACANVANLMLVRATSRHNEIAIRSALGANRAHIIQQLLTESVLLAVLGGGVGLLLALGSVEAIMALNLGNLPRQETIAIDMGVLGFAFGLSLLTGILFGLASVLQSSQVNPNESLREGGHTSSTGGSHRLRSLLIISEIALALVLLISAGLLFQSFVRILGVDPGYQVKNLITFRLSLPVTKYEHPEVRSFFRQLEERVRVLPGVKSVGGISDLPLSSADTSGWGRVNVENPSSSFTRVDPDSPFPYVFADRYAITPGYFKTVGMTLVRGRFFGESDDGEAPQVAIVDESFARRFWPDANPLGKRVATGSGRDPRWHTIVGVIRHARHWLNLDGRPQLYRPYEQVTYHSLFLAVRTVGLPENLLPSIRQQVNLLNPELPIFNVRTMEERLSDSLAHQRFNVLLLGVFAGLAMLLAAVGIYGVLAYTVTQRTHEIGIRMALGARRPDILKLVVRQGMLLVLVGVGFGLAGALALTRLLQNWLFGITATDPATFVGMSVLVAGVGLLACWVPARRATRVDPMVALRYE